MIVFMETKVTCYTTLSVTYKREKHEKDYLRKIVGFCLFESQLILINCEVIKDVFLVLQRSKTRLAQE